MDFNKLVLSISHTQWTIQQLTTNIIHDSRHLKFIHHIFTKCVKFIYLYIQRQEDTSHLISIIYASLKSTNSSNFTANNLQTARFQNLCNLYITNYVHKILTVIVNNTASRKKLAILHFQYLIKLIWIAPVLPILNIKINQKIGQI